MLSQILIAAALATAQAPETEPTPEVETEHHEHAYRWLVATKIITGTSRAAHGNTDLFGPGVDLELTIWPQVGLELEFAPLALAGTFVSGIGFGASALTNWKTSRSPASRLRCNSSAIFTARSRECSMILSLVRAWRASIHLAT